MAFPSASPPPHDRAVIISTGDEIVAGQLQDSNARWLAEQLVGAGIMPIEHCAVGDSMRDLVSTLKRAIDRAPLVIMSGGLGPTDGDLTRPALCELLGQELVLDEEVRASLVELLSRRGRDVSERQLRQAHRPRSARCLPNAFGTAPGLHAVARAGGPHGSADIIALPGPPGELIPMFEACVRPLLRVAAGRVVVTRLLHVVGIAEADCVTRLGELTSRDRTPLIGVTASSGILTIRIRCESDAGGSAAGELVDADESRVRSLLGDHVFAAGPGMGHDRLVRAVLSELSERGQTVGTVESCTGGMLGQFITAVPGSSAAYRGGLVTYSNEQKERLGVDAAELREHGAVSGPVARQMAMRGLEYARVDHCLAITGIAGPDGGTPAKPVGTVHIALGSRRQSTGAGDEDAADPGAVHSRQFLFTGDREDIRRRAAVTALAMLHFALRGHATGRPRLLWQVG